MKEKPFSKYQILANAVMIIWTLAIILPFILLFMSSITDENTLVANGYSFFPKKFSLASYSYIIKSGGQILKAYGVSIGVTVVGTLLNVLLSALMGLSFVSKKSSGQKCDDVLRVLYHAVQRRYRSILHYVDRYLPYQRYDFCTAASKLPAFCMECYDDSNLFYHKHSGWIIRGGRD